MNSVLADTRTLVLESFSGAAIKEVEIFARIK